MEPKSQPQNLQFIGFVFKVNLDSSGDKLVKKVFNTFEEVKQWNVGGDGTITMNGEINPKKALKCLTILKKHGKIEQLQSGECSTNLTIKKKEAAPKTNNNNNNNNNNQDMGPIYPCYYNNGYGGYDNGYGYGYGYGFPYPTFGASNNYATYNDNTLECGGHAADCASHHMQKRDHSSTKKPADDHKSSSKPEKASSSVSFNKLGVHGHKEKRGCCIM